MNKLEVALKLLQLLNERKAIDSKTVAHELNVSLRTAQRYLMELSILPCVRNDPDSHGYYLNPDYPLNHALKGSDRSGDNTLRKKTLGRKLSLNESICLKCGNNKVCPMGCV